ncbi:hypothetical protein PSI15_02400 [Xenorhabdus sp. PR6a]|uniref:hypothetical protein n=1 Tax=Xenorhabdus sp. PR6a TaxID=3025877 RepID=UPI0023596A4F|nr:hypothetical protein [Xenorhabdus sp. PR6a]MDC9580431.1 hypothetical protein [Xenorhabdus sp. PR6a]
MNTNSDLDLTKLSKEELIECYGKYKNSAITHRLWCLAHPEIPINFSSEFVKLIEKCEKLLELNSNGTLSPNIILDALIDSIYSDCRGLFCENEKNSKNYTLQNCLKIANINNAVIQINEIIDKKEFSDEVVRNYSFREWVKFVTDKSIAHKDNLTEDQRQKINYKCKFLNDSTNLLEFLYYLIQIHIVYEKVVMHFGEIELYKYNLSKN